MLRVLAVTAVARTKPIEGEGLRPNNKDLQQSPRSRRWVLGGMTVTGASCLHSYQLSWLANTSSQQTHLELSILFLFQHCYLAPQSISLMSPHTPLCGGMSAVCQARHLPVNVLGPRSDTTSMPSSKNSDSSLRPCLLTCLSPGVLQLRM